MHSRTAGTKSLSGLYKTGVNTDISDNHAQMTKTSIKLFITEDGYRSIGHVAAQWAYLETELDQLWSIFKARKKAGKIKFSNKGSFEKRVGSLKKAAAILLKGQKKDLKEIKKILNDAASLQHHRDGIIHAKWKLKRKGSDMLPDADKGKSLPSYQYNNTRSVYMTADRVAVRISAVTLRLNEWRTRHAGL